MTDPGQTQQDHHHDTRLVPYTDRAGIRRWLTPGVVGYQWEQPSPEILERVRSRRIERQTRG